MAMPIAATLSIPSFLSRLTASSYVSVLLASTESSQRLKPLRANARASCSLISGSTHGPSPSARARNRYRNVSFGKRLASNRASHPILGGSESTEITHGLVLTPATASHPPISDRARSAPSLRLLRRKRSTSMVLLFPAPFRPTITVSGPNSRSISAILRKLVARRRVMSGRSGVSISSI